MKVSEDILRQEALMFLDSNYPGKKLAKALEEIVIKYLREAFEDEFDLHAAERVLAGLKMGI